MAVLLALAKTKADYLAKAIVTNITFLLPPAKAGGYSKYLVDCVVENCI